MNLANWIPIILFGAGLFLAGYGFIYRTEKRVTIIEQRCVTHQAVIDSIATLNRRLDKVANDNETFWKILGPPLSEIIHSPVSRERDELVDKLVHGGIDRDGLMKLSGLLGEALDSGRWGGDKRLAGALLLARVQAELAATGEDHCQEKGGHGCYWSQSTSSQH